MKTVKNFQTMTCVGSLNAMQDIAATSRALAVDNAG